MLVIKYGADLSTAKIQVVLSGSNQSAKADLDLSGAADGWVVREGTLKTENGKFSLLHLNY